jgi:uroporphyrinogen-III synthase
MATRIVIHTGPADRAERWTAALRAAGFEVRPLPAIAVEIVTSAPAVLAEVQAGAPYAVVLVTSARAAAALTAFAGAIGEAPLAAIGDATAAACRREGFEPKWVGASGRRTFLESLAGQVELRGASVLFPRGDLVEDPELPEISGRVARVVAPVVYKTVAAPLAPQAVKAAVAAASGVTLTSPSGVRAFADAADAAGAGGEARRLFAATLGPISEAAAQKAGFSWRGVSRRPSPAALADLLRCALNP